MLPFNIKRQRSRGSMELKAGFRLSDKLKWLNAKTAW